jgi:hypothetical protein
MLVTVIPAPMSTTVQIATRLCGVIYLFASLGSCAAFMSPSPAFNGFKPVIQAVWIWQMVSGFGFLLVIPAMRENTRAKLLKQRDAAAPEDRDQFVEEIPAPDSLAIAMLTGTLSIISISIVFAPFAIIAGVIAAAKGHRSGLVAVLLGFVSAAVWVGVYFYLKP